MRQENQVLSAVCVEGEREKKREKNGFQHGFNKSSNSLAQKHLPNSTTEFSKGKCEAIDRPSFSSMQQTHLAGYSWTGSLKRCKSVPRKFTNAFEKDNNTEDRSLANCSNEHVLPFSSSTAYTSSNTIANIIFEPVVCFGQCPSPRP